jgi:hypothetical protein
VDAHQRRLENLQRLLDLVHSKDFNADTPDIKDKLRRAMITMPLHPDTVAGYVATVMNVLIWEKRTGKKASFKDGILE